MCNETDHRERPEVCGDKPTGRATLQNKGKRLNSTTVLAIHEDALDTASDHAIIANLDRQEQIALDLLVANRQNRRLITQAMRERNRRTIERTDAA